VRYYEENKERMKYDEYLAKGYGIGERGRESAHKQVVQARMRQAGDALEREGARRLLALRPVLNREWKNLDSRDEVPRGVVAEWRRRWQGSDMEHPSRQKLREDLERERRLAAARDAADVAAEPAP
jgi:hypothetical protein